jgi:hypothetical protein
MLSQPFFNPPSVSFILRQLVVSLKYGESLQKEADPLLCAHEAHFEFGCAFDRGNPMLREREWKTR